MKQEILLNRYKVLEKLGEGGMGVVWKVYDEVEKKEVALKEIKTKAGEERLPTGSMLGSQVETAPTVTLSSEPKLRFAEEFRTMRTLQYPYTVKVFDYGVLENGNRYFTMEIVAGTNLKEILKKRKLDFQEIYKILIQLAQTLNFIHSRLYVHRDIKSNNIMITKNGNVKLMDFGLMDRIGVTSEGTMTGTVYYIPPEVLKGGVINESSDLYSLGILGYELTTGKFPFQGENEMDIIRMHMETPHKSLVKSRPDTPPDFEIIISKLLAKEQDDRYQTSPELIEDLSKLSGEEITVETLEEKKSYLYCSKLIGREKETNQLIEAFEKMKKGEGQSFFIGAPAGVGKSRLLQEFKLEIQLSEVPYLEGFCIQKGMSSYQPLKDAFKPILPMTKKEVLDKYGSVLAKIIPELEEKGYQPLPVLEELPEKVRIFENVTGWLKDVSKYTSLVICIEDLHWSDLASIDLLNACIRGLAETPVMFLAAFRDDEVEKTSPIFHTIEEELTKSIKLTTMNQDNVGSLIEMMLGNIELTDEFTERIFNITGGNPFFVTETMRSLIEGEQIKLEYGQWRLPSDISKLEFPASIEATVTRRLKLLSKEALLLAQISSVRGRQLDLSVLAAIINIEEEKLFVALDELIERQFIKKEGRRYIFIHDLVQETLYSQLDKSERREFHEKIGNILEEINVDNIKDVADLLAYHFSRGRNKSKAAKYLLLAGDKSAEKASFVEAIDRYDQATSILETIDYPEKEKILFESRFKLLKCNSFAISPEICMKHCEKIFEILNDLGGSHENIIKQIKVMKILIKVINLLPGKLPDIIKDKLTKEYPDFDLPKRKDYMHILIKIIETSFMYATSFFFLGEYYKGLEYLDNLAENFLPEKKGSVPFACIIAARQPCLIGIGKQSLGKQESEEAISIFDKNVSKLNLLQLQLYTGCLLFYNNHIACSGLSKYNEKYLRKTYELSYKYNFIDWLGWQAVSDLVVAAIRGNSSETENAYNKVCELSKKMGRPFGLETWIYTWWGYYCVKRGAFDLAQKAATTIRKIEKQEVGAQIGYAQWIEIRILTEQDKIQEALPKLEEIVSIHRKHNLLPFGDSLLELAKLYIQIDRLREADSLLKEAYKRVTSEEYRNVTHQAILYRVMGHLSFKEKNFEEAEKHFDESLKVAKENNNPIQEGFTYWAIGELFIELTKYGLAKEFLEEAAAKFKEIDNQYQLKKVQLAQNKLAELPTQDGR